MPTARRTLSCAALALLTLAAPARAAVPHVVAPGESLWSIAAANNFTTRSIAVFNGLAPEAHVVLGGTVRIPTVAEAAAALARAGIVPAPAAGTTTAVASGSTTAGAPGTGAAPAPLGAYVVRSGDTLSGLAARSGVSLAQMAYVNGLDPQRALLIGTVLKLPTGAQISPTAPAPAARVVPTAQPYPTPGRVSAAEIAQVAAAHGVPASLAAAIGWQESGFNNAAVSSANARGVMQIMPGTWDWIESNIAGHALDPSSPRENVHAGVMYLGRLLQETGGDAATAAAGYYQGLASVRRIGLLPDTRQYVASVLALRPRFGG